MSGITKTPTIVPKLLQLTNANHESRHKKQYQEVKFDPSDDDTYSSHTNTFVARPNVEIIGCNTHLMTFDDVITQKIEVVLPEPSAENKGHTVFIKDLDGKCGNGNGSSVSPNEIHVTYFNGTIDTQIHIIDVPYGYEVLFSTGFRWITFLSSNPA
jgi:hypothetical protein